MKKIARRDFISTSTKILAGAVGTASAGAVGSAYGGKKSPPNVLFLMVDQMQTPPEGYRPDEGPAQGLKEILGFRSLSPDNEYAEFFPGLLRLRQNAVVLRKHYTAASACVPSRACILTGQYPCTTGVNHTDGLFKSPEDVPWLDPKGIPTIGHWFRAAGYTTHYFGKWHVSEPEAPDYLEPWGFSNWEDSIPEAHGGNAYNSGTFRDIQFADKVAEFLDKKGKETSNVPWFAVGSLLNPHDCSIWPINWQTPNNTGVVDWQRYPPPPSIPVQGQMSNVGTMAPGTPNERTLQVELNPDGFPQNNSTLPRTYSESLDDKPQCQKDYALKWGLAYGGSTNFALMRLGVPDAIRSPLPFQLREEYAEAWSLGYNQYYAYCHYLVDLQIRRILAALDSSGLSDNTIIVFLSDHGDMTGAHGGMIQKWHVAYEEAIRVPMIVSSPLVNRNRRRMREIHQPTSSVDFAPTILALAGFPEERVRGKMEAVHGQSVVKPFAGADLSSQIKGTDDGDILEPDGKRRAGVLFMSGDMITELGTVNPGDAKRGGFRQFCSDVEKTNGAGHPLAPGPVRQPNNVRALCTGNWKLVHYVDPHGVEADEWELYCLKSDPIEQINLVHYKTGEVREDVRVPGMTAAELRWKNITLKRKLAKKEAALFGTIQAG